MKWWQQKKRGAGRSATAERTAERQWRLRAEAPGAIDSLVDNARRTPWALSFLQVLWVAGPATFIAMQLAYYIGFGQLAPWQNVVYFTFLTLFLGLIAVVSRVVADSLRRDGHQRDTETLLAAIDLIPDLLLAFRDVDLASEPPERRRRMAAGALLNELDLGPEALFFAVRDLTGDTALAQTAQQIEIFRRLGLYSRVQDLVASSTEARLAALARAHSESPECADVLRWRLLGDAPSTESGLPRREGFLRRLLQAADNDFPADAEIADVRELLLLCFELLNGREIRYLRFRFRGIWKRERLLDELERHRAKVLVVQARMLNDLRHLALQIHHADPKRITVGDMRGQVSLLASRVLEQVRVILNQKAPRGSATAERIAAILRSLRRFQRSRNHWIDAISRYDAVLIRWQRLRRGGKLAAVIARVRRVLQPSRSAAIEVFEERIALTPDERISIAEGILEIATHTQIVLDGHGAKIAGEFMECGDVQQIGLAVLTILNEVLDLTHPAIQRAIHATPAIWSGALHTAMSAEDKARMGAALVKDLPDDLAPLAEHLAAQLRGLYEIQLDSGLIDFLCERFGANRERLETLAMTPVQPRAEVGRLMQPWEPILRLTEWDRLSRARRAVEQ
ncbi:MAG: hypothetical protein ACK4IT_09065 [Thioalkalivibrionaceae bacterium]